MMIKNIRILLTICLLSIAVLVVLQFFWIKNYYKTSLFDFERETNLSFEDAIKKEFQLRNDTIQDFIIQQLMDTSAFKISSKFSLFVKKDTYTISDAKNRKDITTVSFDNIRGPLKANDTLMKKQIAILFSKSLRSEDLENHIIIYRTQNLGNFLNEKVMEYSFDTNRLRPILTHYLKERDIQTNFHFSITGKDSLLNQINFSDSLIKNSNVITKAFPTYKWRDTNYQYVRAVFDNPVEYVLGKMKRILLGSVLLVALVILCVWLLLKALFHEKKLTAIKNDFINNITHELKTPVATISAAAEALQDFNLSEDKQQRYIAYTRNEADKLSRLIESILNISLHTKNKIPFNQEKIAIKEIIFETIENLKVSAEKQVNFTFVNETGINNILVDKQLFRQAISNILENAIKYSGPEVNICVDCFISKKYLHIRCVDNGFGIESSSLPYIFEKFYREPKNNHSIKGYGLGLSYVQEIMKVHHGKIHIDSIKEKGTKVILSWPV